MLPCTIVSCMEKNRKLKAALAELGIPQWELANRLGMDHGRLSKILSGRLAMPADFEELAQEQVAILRKAEKAKQEVLNSE